MSSEATSVILLGLGCAANPWGIMVAVLLLNAQRGLWVVWAYVAAWVASISVVMALLLAGFGSTDSSSETTNKVVSYVEIALGLLLLAFGVMRVLKARRQAAAPATEEQEQPKWLQTIAEISVIGAFVLGIYSATYPMVVAAAGEILRGDYSRADEVTLAVVFVVIGSSTVFAVAALGTFAKARSAAMLERMRGWLTLHNAAVLTVIILVFGLALTSRGIQAL